MIDNETLVPGFDDEKDDNLKITIYKIESIPNCISIILNGYVDTYNSTFFQKQMFKIIEAGFVNLIFNCSALDYVSSAGIGSFASFLKTVKPKGGDVVLLEIQPKVFEVFQLLGFSQFFNIKNSLEEAITYFKAGTLQNISAFPKIFDCPMCQKKLKATRPGRFSCIECKSILTIDGEGQVILG